MRGEVGKFPLLSFFRHFDFAGAWVLIYSWFSENRHVASLTPHSHQNVICLRSGEGYCRFYFIEFDTANELLTPLLTQLNFLCGDL